MPRDPKVMILLGSATDLDAMSEAARVLERFDVPYQLEVTSAHRSPERTLAIVALAESRGCAVYIVGAGMAAHLGGVVAAHTTKPVLGVPMEGKQHQTGWQAPFGDIPETLFVLPREPAKIYEGRQPCLGKTLPPDEPIAIVAMACRYPGALPRPEQLWQLLIERRVRRPPSFPTIGAGQTISMIPMPRSPANRSPSAAGFIHTGCRRSILRRSASAPAEATTIDPQQRILLELAWEA
ncbi:MAG: hypothetical protein HC882_07325, partial [Acidobacteria bacterium]|nr:hypothetical protein [Acidobacteriota bacterium]